MHLLQGIFAQCLPKFLDCGSLDVSVKLAYVGVWNISLLLREATLHDACDLRLECAPIRSGKQSCLTCPFKKTAFFSPPVSVLRHEHASRYFATWRTISDAKVSFKN